MLCVGLYLPQLKELEEEWAKLPGVPPVPPRRLRSNQAVAAVSSAAGEEEDKDDDTAGAAASYAPAQVDPYDLADPVDMLAKMPKDFYEKIVRCLSMLSNEPSDQR